MSTFFGIFHTDFKPVEPDVFQRMETVMNHWRADSSGHFVEQGISMGTLVLSISSQAIPESLPYTSGSYTISGDIRLDNREEIVQKLGEERWSGPDLPDYVLLLELFKRIGSNSVKYLVGDFAFCIWNEAEKSLFCARDHLGVRPFYYYYKDNLFAFASEKKGILSIPGVDASINQEFCLLLHADLDTPREQTFFQHIKLVPPAFTMEVNAKGIRTQRYWKLEKPPVLRLGNAEEYYEGFRALFKKAVAARIKTSFPVGVELSGGLDSAGVLGITASVIGDKHKLYSFSNVALRDDNGLKRTADEEEWINHAIAFNDIVHARKVSTGGWRDIFEPIDFELAVHSSPMTYCTTWLEPIRRSMLDEGVRVALSGYGGDEFVTNPGVNYFYDIFYEKDFRLFFEVCMRKKIPLMPAKMLLRTFLLKLGLNAFKGDQKRPPVRCSILKDKKLEAQLSKVFDSSMPNRPLNRSHKSMIVEILSRPWLNHRLDAEAGFAINHRLINCYPLLDLRILTYFLSVPANLIGQPSLSRAFFRNAMVGLIPDPIRLREDKSIPSSPFSALEAEGRMEGYLSWIKSNEHLFGKGPLSYIDFDEVVRRFDPLVSDNYVGGVLIPKVNAHTMSMVRYFERIHQVS